MKKILIGLITTTAFFRAEAQTKDTIFVNEIETSIIEFRGDFGLKQVDISASATSDIKAVKGKDVFFNVNDTGMVIKLKAIKPFAGRCIMTVIAENSSFQYEIVYKKHVTKTLFTYDLGRRPTRPSINAGSLAETDHRTELEKNASILISPKNKLFSALRSKNQNMSLGDFHGGVRIFLEKLYQAGNRTYFMFKISNFSMKEFQLESFAINVQDGTGEQPVQYINEETAFNLLKRYEKVDFIVIAEDVQLSSTGKLVFTFKKTDSADKGLFRFFLDAKGLQKRQAL